MRDNKKRSGNQDKIVKEDKVVTEYLSSNIDRVQAIKHVSTSFKPEYMSLEEIQRMKEEHEKRLLKTENEYFEKKKKNDYSINRFERIKDEFDLSEFGALDDKAMYNNDELIKTIDSRKNLNKSLNKQLNKTRNSRAKSAKFHLHKGEDRPLTNDEQKYLRNYMNYQLKKKYVSNTFSKEKDENFWNTTRIRSLNRDGGVNRKDGLPGHIDREDYSLYYLSISSDGPLSLSFRSASGSRSHSKRTINLSYDQGKAYRPAKSKYSAYKSNKAASFKAYERINPEKKLNNQQMNSHIAFIKMIFNLIDKERAGYIVKMDCINTLHFDSNILTDLGFTSSEHFVNILNNFQTEQEGIMTEKEFIAFLLCQSELAGEEGNLNENINEFNNDHLNGEDDKGTPQAYNTDNPYTAGNELGENSKEVKTFNNKLTKDLRSKISSSQAGGKKEKEKDSRIKVSYKDFKDFTNLYKTRSNFSNKFQMMSGSLYLNLSDSLKLTMRKGNKRRSKKFLMNASKRKTKFLITDSGQMN
jgi:hypothetical protein